MKRPDWIVRKVEALEDYRLRLFFENGDCRIFDMKPYLDEFPWRPLRNQGAVCAGSRGGGFRRLDR